MRYPSKQIAELMKWAKPHGCEYVGINKSGHAVIRLPGGEEYTTGATPSDRNAIRAAKRGLAERLGIAFTPKPKGHYRKNIGRAPRFSMRAALQDRRPDTTGSFSTSTARVDPALARLQAEEKRLRAEWEKNPTGAIEVSLRNVRARIANGLY